MYVFSEMDPDDFDRLNCHLNLLSFQKKELVDSLSTILNLKSNLLLENILLCSFPIPNSNENFKKILYSLYQTPIYLRNFSLSIGQKLTSVCCKVYCDNCIIDSDPFFIFENREYFNLDMLRKQLNNLRFQYPIAKSHLFFHVITFDGSETTIEFFHNPTRDCFAIHPSGKSFTEFLQKFKNKITSTKPLSVPVLGNLQPVAQSQPSGSLATELTPKSSRRPHLVAADSDDLNIAAPLRRKISFSNQPIHCNNFEPELLTSRPNYISATRLNNTASDNKNILSEIAQEKSLKIDTDQISAILTPGTTWKTTHLGLMILALEGVIPIQDKRLPDLGLDPDLETSGEVTFHSDAKQKEHEEHETEEK